MGRRGTEGFLQTPCDYGSKRVMKIPEICGDELRVKYRLEDIFFAAAAVCAIYMYQLRARDMLFSEYIAPPIFIQDPLARQRGASKARERFLLDPSSPWGLIQLGIWQLWVGRCF